MSNPTLKRTARQAAIRWFVLMQEADAEHPQRSTFEHWLLAHPSHQQAYSEVCSLWEDMDSPAQLAHLESAMQQKSFIEKTERSQKIRSTLNRTLSVLFIATIGTLGYLGYEDLQAEPTMHLVASAEIGQIRSQVLEDGSKIMVNANSDVEVIYYRKQRIVKLNRGEVSFDVAKNPERPFVVESGMAKITVLGTRFAVNRFKSKVRVSVDHGTVRVEPQQYGSKPDTAASPTAANKQAEHVLTLRDNEVAEINISGQSSRVNRAAADAFSFEYGTITFDGAGLEEIAETLSRYRKIPISTQAVSGLDASVTAVIQAKNVERFIKELPIIAPVQVKRSSDAIILISQASQASAKRK